MTAIGVTGALQLKKKLKDPSKKKSNKKKVPEPDDPKIDYIKSIYNALDFGIKIQMATAPFSRTKVVTIVPRYILANNLNFPLVYRQADIETKHQEFVPSGSHEPLYLPEIDPDGEAEIMLRTAVEGEEEQKTEQALTETKEVWSSGFSIIDIEDFQVRFLRENSPGGKHWSVASKLNAYRQFVRVEVVSLDDATIFICLNTPSKSPLSPRIPRLHHLE